MLRRLCFKDDSNGPKIAFFTKNAGSAEGETGRILMFNQHAGRLYKEVHCKVTRQFKTEAQMVLKT